MRGNELRSNLNARAARALASSAAYDTKVAGVVSEQTGGILGTGGEGR